MRQLRIVVGPPDASLEVWILEPTARPRGTILVLHGWHRTKSGMLHFGEEFAKAGYRAVLCDLRGHGQSTGDWLTYGVLESRDIEQVIEAIPKQEGIVDNIGLLGISYGAAVAIQSTRSDRVRAVVAVASFASLRNAAADIARLMLPIWTWMVGESGIQASVDEAGRMAGFDPDRASPVDALRRARIPVLLIHGLEDRLIPPDHALELLRVSPPGSRLHLLGGFGHNDVFADPGGQVSGEAIEWFDHHLQGLPPGAGGK